MKQKIILAFQDSGVANAVGAALPLLADEFDMQTFAFADLAYKELASTLNPIEQKRIGLTEQPLLTLSDAQSIVRRENPVAVITGLSDIYKNPTAVDFMFAEAAAVLSIKSIGIFEPIYLPKDTIEHRLNRDRVLPEKLIVASEIMKEALEKMGLYSAADLSVLPMPKYQSYAAVMNNPKLFDIRRKLRAINHIDDTDFVIIFSSSRNDLDPKVLDILAAVSNMKNTKILLTFHTKETESFKNACRARVPGSAFLKTDGVHILEAVKTLALGTDGVIVSLKSALLFDAAAVGANTLGISPEGKDCSPAAAVIVGNSDCVQNASELVDALDVIRTKGAEPIKTPFADSAAVQKFCDGLRKLLESK